MENRIVLSKKELRRLICWSSSRINTLRKQRVVALIYDMLVQGEGMQIFGSGTYMPTTGWSYPAYLVDGSSGYIACDENGGTWVDYDTFQEDWRVYVDVPEKTRQHAQRIREATQRLINHAQNASHAWTTDVWRAERPGKDVAAMPSLFRWIYADEKPDSHPLAAQEALQVWWAACRREGMRGVAMIEHAERQAREDQRAASEAAPVQPRTGGLTAIINALAQQMDEQERKDK